MPTYAVTINGVSQTIQPGWSITESANGRSRMDLRVLSLTGADRWVHDDEIAITEDGVKIFGGLLDNPVESGFGGTGATSAIELRLSFVDFNVYPSRVTVDVDTARPSETLKARLTWIAGLMSAQGVTLAVGQANGPTLEAASYAAGRYLVDVLGETMALADGTGTSSWIWNISYTKVLSAIETGTAAAPFNIADGDSNVLGDIVVEQPRPADYGNYVILLAGSGLRYIEFERHDADGVTRRFRLNAPVVSLVGALRLNAGPGGFPVGIYGVDDLPWTFDASTNEIVQRSDQPVLGVGEFIEMSYNGQFPVQVISDGGVAAANRVTKTYQEPDIFDLGLAQALAHSYRVRDMQSPKTARVNCAYDKTGLHPGQTLTITSAKRNLSGTFLITDVRIAHVQGQLVQRQLTMVSTTRLPSTLRAKFRQAFGGSTAAMPTSSIGGTVTSGGVTGTGTVGRIAKFAAATSLADSIMSESGSVVSVLGALALTRAGVTQVAWLQRLSDHQIGLGQNLMFDGANFNLDDVARSGWLARLTGDGGATNPDSFVISRAAPGANPRTLTTLLHLTGSAALGIGTTTGLATNSITIPNAGALRCVNAANSASIGLIGLDAADRVAMNWNSGLLVVANALVAGAAGALAGYLRLSVNGSEIKIPYHAP